MIRRPPRSTLFPTRRSSDLEACCEPIADSVDSGKNKCIQGAEGCRDERAHAGAEARSEEHTSEPQSQSNLVCRLLLEKKKKTNNNKHASELPSTNALRLPDT